MALTKFDLDAWPILVITLAPVMNQEEIDFYMLTLRPIYVAGCTRPFVVIADARKLNVAATNAQLRQAFAEGLQKLNTEYPASKIGEAAVITSALVRGVYLAVNWFRRQQSGLKLQMFENVVDAKVWAADVISAHDLKA